MPKPPATPPQSDIDGVDEDEVRNTDAADASGQGPADLDRAQKLSKGRPDFSRERGRDERSN